PEPFFNPIALAEGEPGKQRVHPATLVLGAEVTRTLVVSHHALPVRRPALELLDDPVRHGAHDYQHSRLNIRGKRPGRGKERRSQNQPERDIHTGLFFPLVASSNPTDSANPKTFNSVLVRSRNFAPNSMNSSAWRKPRSADGMRLAGALKKASASRLTSRSQYPPIASIIRPAPRSPA